MLEHLCELKEMTTHVFTEHNYISDMFDIWKKFIF